MAASRLTLAVETGALPLPAQGRIGLFRARPDHDLSAFPAERLHIVQGFCPHYRSLAAQGLDCSVAPEGPYAAVLVAATRSKEETLGLIAEALAETQPGGLVAVDAQKTEGAEALLKACKRALDVEDVISKAHGKLFTLRRPETLPETVAGWAKAAAARPGGGGFVTRPGIFSSDGADPGSVLLADHLPDALKGRVADLGAGWGYLSHRLLALEAVTQLDLVEAEHAALESARANITDPRAHFLWEDATSWRPGAVYDAVISNPPFHTGRAADASLGQAFIRTAAAILKPGGQFWMVANRQLPYERTLEAAFREVETVAETPAYKIFRAARPAPPSKRGARPT